MRRGLVAAKGNLLFLCDADLNSGFSECAKLESALLAGADVAIGSRRCGDSDDTRPWYRFASSRIFNLCSKQLLGLKFKDTLAERLWTVSEQLTGVHYSIPR